MGGIESKNEYVYAHCKSVKAKMYPSLFRNGKTFFLFSCFTDIK